MNLHQNLDLVVKQPSIISPFGAMGLRHLYFVNYFVNDML